MVITVTGSTGTIGSELVRLLSQAGAPTRAVSRRASDTRLNSVVRVQADLSDTSLLDPVLAGTDRLFVLTDNTPGFGKLQIEVIRAAERLGLAHVVKLSALGASDHSKSSIAREHWQVEQALQQTSLNWTVLRPHAFMQNWLDDVADSVRTRGVIEQPIGDGRVPFIDTRDIAAVAAEVLLHPDPHVGHKYSLTGREAAGYADLAEAITQATGKPVRYQPISLEEARDRLKARSIPQPLIEAMLAIAAYQKAGGPTSLVSDKIEHILGRPARTIRDFVRDHVQHFT